MSICWHSRHANGIMFRSAWASGGKPASRRLKLVDFSMGDRRPPFLSSRGLRERKQLKAALQQDTSAELSMDGWEWALTRGRNGNSACRRFTMTSDPMTCIFQPSRRWYERTSRGCRRTTDANSRCEAHGAVVQAGSSFDRNRARDQYLEKAARL